MTEQQVLARVWPKSEDNKSVDPRIYALKFNMICVRELNVEIRLSGTKIRVCFSSAPKKKKKLKGSKSVKGVLASSGSALSTASRSLMKSRHRYVEQRLQVGRKLLGRDTKIFDMFSDHV